MERNLPIRHIFNTHHPFDIAYLGIYVYRTFAAFLLTIKLHGEAPKAIFWTPVKAICIVETFDRDILSCLAISS